MTTRKRKNHGTPDPAILADLVKRIVAAAKPEKIILFGSAARGTMGPDSDYDLLVIKRGKFNYWRVLSTIEEYLSGKEAAVDIVLVTPEDVERYRDSHCLVICPALEEGKVFYDAETSAAGRPARMAEPRARGNLARAMVRVPGAYLEDNCFDAQQTAEKAIKAVFICRGTRFPFNHDLDELLRMLLLNGLKIPKYVQRVKSLSRFAGVTRYPGAVRPVTERQYHSAVRIAAAVLRWAERMIGLP